MIRLPQILSDIRSRHFQSEEKEIESARRGVGLHIKIMGSVILIVSIISGILIFGPILPPVQLSGPVIIGTVLLSLFGGTGYALWRMSRK